VLSSSLVKAELSERARQLDLAIVENESGTVQIEATSDEIDDFQRMKGIGLDSDVLPDELLEKLLNHLKREALLEK
jgi:hypothetical protein